MSAGDGELEAADFAQRVVEWLPIGRGKGRATTRAASAMRAGIPWWEAAELDQSGGNGAAMRAAPIGLAFALDATPQRLWRNAVLSSLPTHNHPVGVAGAVAIAAGVAWCVRTALAGSRIDVQSFVAFVSAMIEDIEAEPSRERRAGGREIRLVDRLREIPTLLEWDSPERVFAYTHNGAFALESVPAALYCFLQTPDDPRQVILTAVNAGYDADTVASMAGN